MISSVFSVGGQFVPILTFVSNGFFHIVVVRQWVRKNGRNDFYTGCEGKCQYK